MPPLPPPPECAPHLEQREDDTEEVVRRRLQVGRKKHRRAHWTYLMEVAGYVGL
jgi:adenylate kinase family enzyme